MQKCFPFLVLAEHKPIEILNIQIVPSVASGDKQQVEHIVVALF